MRHDDAKNSSPYLIPNASRPVVRNRLVVLSLQILHRIVQEEIDENSVDAVCLFRFFMACFLKCFLLWVLVLRVCFFVKESLAGRLFAAHFDLRVSALDLSFDQFHAPDACSPKLDLPVGAWFNGFQVADMAV